jgi:Elongation factor G, domain IV
MSEHLRKWADGLLTARPWPLSQRVTVVGERDAHLGPRLEFARVRISIEPAAQFEVVELTEPSEELRMLGYPESVVLGVLDILMVALSAPVKGVRIVLEEAEYDPIDSSPLAFRQAGRDAGRKVVEAISKPVDHGTPTGRNHRD